MMSDYYQRYVIYIHEHSDPQWFAPSYRNYLEGQLAIAEAEVERVTEERDGLGTQVTHLQEQVWRADNEIERLREERDALETEASVYRAVHLPTVNVDAGQEATDG